MITLRGFETVREILQGYVEYLNEGLAPESFDLDDGTPRYGDPAPALWLVLAGELYVRRSEDQAFARDVLYPALEGVSHSYRSGTSHGVHVDADGLLVAGEGAEATKRADLNALWYHASVAIAQLARSVGRKEMGAFHLAWAREHQRRFNEALWDEERGCLHHALEDEPVSGLGPGQLLAVSLPPSLLPPERATRLVETVERELFTPFGLRETPDSSRVSPAWLGTFYSAYLRARGRGPEAQSQVRDWLEPLYARLADGRCALLPEAFEVGPLGDHAEPAGESVSILGAAELARVWVEELDHAEASAEF